MALTIYPLNPAYGAGVFRRRLRLVGDDASVTAVLNDDFHSMWCRIGHDGTTVRSVEADTIRIPKTTCPGAVVPLQELVGTALSSDRKSFYGSGRAGRNCTHLLDLARLAIQRAGRGRFTQIFDIVLPDAVDNNTGVQLFIDGELAYDWTLHEDVIVAPAAFAGRRLFAGFAEWAGRQFEGDALDGALMIQKAFFVARGRRYIFDQQGAATNLEPEREGRCFTFSEPQFSVARDMIGYVRDYSKGLGEVLPPHLRATIFTSASENIS